VDLLIRTDLLTQSLYAFRPCHILLTNLSGFWKWLTGVVRRVTKSPRSQIVDGEMLKLPTLEQMIICMTYSGAS